MAHNAHGRVGVAKKDRISRSVSYLIVARDRENGHVTVLWSQSTQACNKKRAGEPTLTLLDNELALVSYNNACDFIARDVVVSVFN